MRREGGGPLPAGVRGSGPGLRTSAGGADGRESKGSGQCRVHRPVPSGSGSAVDWGLRRL